MFTKIISIGNSKGIRIPQALLAEFDFNDLINITKTKDKIILEPVKKVREGWVDGFKKNKKSKIDFVANDFDNLEWKW
ncbi:MAG: AbrB/MazE/SpoVT family DNA-binding domain-containing protein [Pseudomonadota bacterium]